MNDRRRIQTAEYDNRRHKTVKKPHYAWVICFAGLWMILCNMGVGSSMLTIYLPFIEAQGISHSVGSSLLTVKCLFSFLTIFAVGVYYRKLSLRLGMCIATLIGAAGTLVYCLGGVPAYYLGASLAGIAYGAGTVYPVSLLLANWFRKDRGLAVGITSAGSGVATMLFSPIVTSVIVRHSLRAAFLLQAAFLTAGAGQIWLIVRDTPEETGREIYGGEAAETASAQEDGQDAPLPRSVLWMLAVMMLLNGGVGFSFIGHLSVLSIGCGYPAEVAARTVSLFGMLMVTGKFLTGGIADRIGTKRCSVLLLTLFFLGCLCVTGMDGRSMLWLTLLAVLLGFGSSVFNVGPPLWAAELSSRPQYASTMRWMQLFYNLGGIAFTAVPGMIADRTGEYRTSYYLFAAMVAVSLLILFLVYREASHRGLTQGTVFCVSSDSKMSPCSL